MCDSFSFKKIYFWINTRIDPIWLESQINLTLIRYVDTENDLFWSDRKWMT